MTSPEQPLDYKAAGVDTSKIDPAKVDVQKLIRGTLPNLEQHGMQAFEESVGSTAFVWREGNTIKAGVHEILGTKNLVADEVEKETGATCYRNVGIDAFAMAANDIAAVGAKATVVFDAICAGSNEWFDNKERLSALQLGILTGCQFVGATWGGGETATLKGIIEKEASYIDLSAQGVVPSEDRLMLGDKLQEGDAILLVQSSGIHANGLTLARKIADLLPDRYDTPLGQGNYGGHLLEPTILYQPLIQGLFDAGIDLHYASPITGEGWRKIMRAKQEFSYFIYDVPEAQRIFHFIQAHAQIDDKEMYGTFNMGAGLALFLPENQVKRAQKIAQQDHRLYTIDAGVVDKGPRQVVIVPKKVVFEGEELGVR